VKNLQEKSIFIPPYGSIGILSLLCLFCLFFVCFFTGSIARSASRRYLIYSEADFEVFRPAGATRYTDGGEIWHGGGDRGSPPPCQISLPIGATVRV